MLMTMSVTLECVAQMANNARVLGIVLMHATGTSAGLFDMMKDKVCVHQSVDSLCRRPTNRRDWRHYVFGLSVHLCIRTCMRLSVCACVHAQAFQSPD